MWGLIRRKLNKRRLKNTFQEYGYDIERYPLEGVGEVEYARWLHPLLDKHELSDPNLRFYRQLLQPGDLAIDIGAHDGDTTVPMALAAGKEGLVIALEPNPYAFKVLQKNAELNPKLTNIEPLPYAATREAGTFTFHYSDASFGNGGFLSRLTTNRHGHRFELQVQGIDLDRYLREHYADRLPGLRLVKVDAEGYDKEILKNISSLLREFQPQLMVECYKRLNREERYELYELITGMGYRLFYLENFEADGARIPLKKADMTARRHFEMLAVPGKG